MTKSKTKAPTAGESRCSCTALRKAARRLSQLYDTALEPSGLKITQRAVLAQINRSEPTTVGKLASALVMDAGALAHTLKPLDRDGLVSIEIDPGDRRSRLIRLTLPGRAKLAESDKLWVSAQAGFDATLGERADSFGRMLRFLISDEFSEAYEARLSAQK